MTRRLAVGLVLMCVVQWNAAGRAREYVSSTGIQESGASKPVSIWDELNKPHRDIVVLYCRGGAGFQFTSLGFNKATSIADWRVAVAMTFAANETGAGDRNDRLAPGTCAPASRPLSAAEPRQIQFVVRAYAGPFKGPIDASRTAADYQTDVRSLPEYLKHPGQYWTFNASDTRQGYFVSWMHRSWKPAGSQPQDVKTEPEVTLDQVAGWLVRVGLSGGLLGRTSQLSISAAGPLQAAGGGTRCLATLGRPQLQNIEAALARSRVDQWRPAYVLKGNENGCCDQFRYSVEVEQEDARGRRVTYKTFWHDDSALTVPEGILSLFKIVSGMKTACAAF